MELYYKDLISEESSLEKLIDDLSLVVQGANDFASATGASVPNETHAEILSRLQRLKEGCRRVKAQATRTALAANKVVKQYPYSSVAFAFGVGLLAGALTRRRR
jgi:ElaB/YqjD/DUF883 family membrane-anchored ribosome-binding protein